MAVLTQNIQYQTLLPGGGLNTVVQPMAGYTNFAGGSTAHTIFKGSICVCDVSDTDGYVRAVPLTGSTNMAGGDIFVGVAAEKQSVTSADTADGSVEVSLYINGIWGFAVGSLGVTDIGAAMYASDDQIITSSSSNTLWVGYLVKVADSKAWVDISLAVNRPNSAT